MSCKLIYTQDPFRDQIVIVTRGAAVSGVARP